MKKIVGTKTNMEPKWPTARLKRSIRDRHSENMIKTKSGQVVIVDYGLHDSDDD
jgi:hypothetical protein